ncbi:MAG TPA: hypothetical protein PLG90_12425, partial [Ignavibacteria bacterium]|nr:hypothetical protein [Ignavibacteria bacterium]
MKYFSEIQMSTHFQKIFFNSFKNESFKILKELEGVTGRPDFFFIFKENDCLISTISIELKLRDWKKALSQAFKYRFYSNQAIVILDSNYSEPAIKNLDKFKKFNVGLCSLNKKDCKLIIHYVPN